MEKVILYIRVSSKEQEIEGYSVPAQRKFLQEYCSKKGYVIAKEFIDIETAKKSGRMQFEAMITYAKENKLAKHIIVEKTDRLLRNIRDYALIDNLIERSDSVIHLVKENAMLSRDSRSNEKFMFGIRAVVAKN